MHHNLLFCFIEFNWYLPECFKDILTLALFDINCCLILALDKTDIQLKTVGFDHTSKPLMQIVLETLPVDYMVAAGFHISQIWNHRNVYRNEKLNTTEKCVTVNYLNINLPTQSESFLSTFGCIFNYQMLHQVALHSTSSKHRINQVI